MTSLKVHFDLLYELYWMSGPVQFLKLWFYLLASGKTEDMFGSIILNQRWSFLALWVEVSSETRTGDLPRKICSSFPSIETLMEFAPKSKGVHCFKFFTITDGFEQLAIPSGSRSSGSGSTWVFGGDQLAEAGRSEPIERP